MICLHGGEVVDATAETPYPSLKLNTNPGGLLLPSLSSGETTARIKIALGSDDQPHFISFQVLYLTPDYTV